MTDEDGSSSSHAPPLSSGQWRSIWLRFQVAGNLRGQKIGSSTRPTPYLSFFFWYFSESPQSPYASKRYELLPEAAFRKFLVYCSIGLQRL